MAFSLLNLAAHAHCLVMYVAARQGARRAVRAYPPAVFVSAGGSRASRQQQASGPPWPYPYAWAVLLQGLLSVNAWLWSAVFHSRDTKPTERLDYFSADIIIFFNLFLTIIRTARITSQAAWVALGSGILIFLARCGWPAVGAGCAEGGRQAACAALA